MTVKEAIVKVLEHQKTPLTYMEVHKLIVDNNYVDWSNAKTPSDTTSAQLGSFIRKNDTRVKRIKNRKGYFVYYLSKYEDEIILPETIEEIHKEKPTNKTNSYQERDLHKLLSSYLKNKNIYSKTIFHEQSKTNDNHQKWIHPDMIGVKFLSMKNKSSLALMKVINKSDSFELTSYEIKREIKSDYELKKTYFQAVSNSSWANYGYLVAFDISSNLKEEMERLNQSFGIGIIELKANPYESEVLFTAKSKELDFKTIDKLCEINNGFERFIHHTESLINVSDRYLRGVRKEFEEFCDDYFLTDTEVESYCKEKYIPFEIES